MRVAVILACAAALVISALAITTDDVINAGVTVSAVRRSEDGDRLPSGLRDKAAVFDEAVRGFAREAPREDLDAIVDHHRAEMDALLPRSEFFGETDAKASEKTLTTSGPNMFGPLSAAPEQIHLGLADSDDAAMSNVSVMWVTSTATTTGRVCVKCSSDEACHDVESYTYTPISVLPWHGTLHRGFMSVPAGATDCEYRVGPTAAESTNTSLWSTNITFNAPNTADADRPLFVALGGDMGTIQLVGWKVAAQMHAYDEAAVKGFDAFWHLGDIAYSTLDPPKLNFEFFWDMYLRQEQPLLNHVPMLATYGNHDFAGGDSAAFIHRFWNPRGLGGNANFYFAKRQGPVLYVSMCTEMSLNPTECDYSPGSKQYLWLESTFAAVNRTETPWIVLAGHRPMYSSDRSTDSGPLREYIEPLLTRYAVDLQVAGHMHCTELTSPVADFVANKSGVVALGGNAWRFEHPGATVHATLGTLGAVIAERFDDPQPAWSVFREGSLFSDAYGFATLNATRSELTVTFLKQSDGAVLWQVQLTK